MDSFSACVNLEDRMSYSVDGDTFTVVYDIGDDSFTADALPTVLTKERMENDILSKLTEDDKEVVLKRFSLYERKELDSNALKTIKLSFPSIEKYDLYIRSKMPDYIAEEIYALFQKAGYTLEDLQRDCDQNNIENTYKAKPSFHIELQYTLNEDGFKVTIDTEKIEYNSQYKPCRIEILPFFGAAVSEKAFMLVPDGCGAVIEFDNGKYNSNPYWKKFFNGDNALITEETEAKSQPSVLPIFAISKENGGFLATIDSGYEVGGISCDVAGGNNKFNYIYPFFDVFSFDKVSLSSNEQDKFILTSEKILSCPIEISYHFLSGSPSYTDLALKYREILINNGILSKKRESSTAINLDLIGTAQVTKRFLGVPYKATAALTTYNQAYKMVKALESENVGVNFVDSLKGGRVQKKADNLKLQKMLGSNSQKSKLNDIAERFSVSFYGQYAASVKKSNTAITLSKSTAKLYDYDLISRYVNSENALSVVASSKLDDFAKRTAKSIKAQKYNAVNLLDMGYSINSNFDTDRSTDRHNARVSVEKYLKQLSKVTEVTVSVGSIFSLPYISGIKDIPTTSSGYHIEDYAVPFYQIAISGYLPFSVTSINTASDSRAQFLRAVELGGQLQYSWSYSLPENIAGNASSYHKYLYKNSSAQAKEFYEEYKPLYDKINGHSIVDHSRISDLLIKTVYDNGVTVYVNYSDVASTVEDTEVGANGFVYVEQGGE